MKKVLTGTYAGRPILVSSIQSHRDVESLHVHDAMVFVWSGNKAIVPSIVEALLVGGAIGIWIGGAQSAEENFDLLLEILSRRNTASTHVMSGMADSTDITDALDEFLAAALPDPAALEAWRHYDILILESGEAVNAAVSHISEIY